MSEVVDFLVLVHQQNDIKAGVFVILLAFPLGLLLHGSKMLLGPTQCVCDYHKGWKEEGSHVYLFFYQEGIIFPEPSQCTSAYISLVELLKVSLMRGLGREQLGIAAAWEKDAGDDDEIHQ